MIAASLIVRNEATEILDCLDSLADLDLIVVVDTGSEDETRELVAAWTRRRPDGPRVVQGHFRWIDDFAAARNFAANLAAAEGAQWILTMSADERMAPGSIDCLRQHLARLHGYPCRTVAITQRSQRGGWEHRRVLVHRPGVRWVGAIHENLGEDSGETAADVVMVYGWSISHHRDPSRNLRILLREAQQSPTARTCYYLGAEYMDHRRPDEAEPWFRRCIELTDWRAEKADAWLYLAKIAWHDQRGDEAREAALKSLLLAPDCRETLELMAEMSWPAEAAIWHRYALAARNTGVIFARRPAASIDTTPPADGPPPSATDRLVAPLAGGPA
jgi:tetratricopeptide (TPR) repeat protein